MKKIMSNKKGFTLIELIVVIAIIAILALILVPQITGYITDAKVATAEANARTCYTEAMTVYTAEAAGLTPSVSVEPECTVTYDTTDVKLPISVTYTSLTDSVMTGTYTAN